MPDALALFELLIERHLAPVPSFVGAILVGSRIHGEERETSDIDCVLLFEDVDDRIIPGEFVWTPDDDRFHSIFEVDAAQVGGVQVDAIGRRLSWEEFSTMEWPEGFKHDLAKCRVVFERGRDVAALLRARTSYDDDTRLMRLAEAVKWMDYHLTPWRLQGWTARGGSAGAHYQIDAAFEELMNGLHAYSRVWLPWRYRRLASTMKLPWLPHTMRTAVEALRTPASAEALSNRRELMAELHTEFVHQLESDGLADEVRLRQFLDFRGLGFARSMDAWREAHAQWIRESGQG